jgi:catechol 2,3-dioxygenase-like lactoylglutathione lyase family enzyme
VTPEGDKSVRTRTCDAGNAHMGINVDDLAWEYQRLTDLGVEFRSAPIVVSDGPDAGVKAVYLSDPDGNTVELVEWDVDRRRERDA